MLSPSGVFINLLYFVNMALNIGQRVCLGFALLAVGVSCIAGCSGKFGLRFGDELCDSTRPCAVGSYCDDGICRSGEDPRRSNSGGSSVPVFDGDWTDPSDANVSPPIEASCRTDAQCGPREACVQGECLSTPCADVACGESESCGFQCIPTSAACEGVVCAPGLEVCSGGRCVPSCTPDLCDVGCDPTADSTNCSPQGQCINDTVCLGGRCVDVLPCDNRFCPDGFLCSLLGCQDVDPCNPSPCQPGWSCRVEDGAARCVENLCSGVRCGAGEVCRSGNCVDPCASIPCDQGGRLCPDNASCCDKVCCEAGLQCRDGECLPPAGICEPQCEPGEICVDSRCVCRNGAAGQAVQTSDTCPGGECCQARGEQIGPGSAVCEDPCSPNTCPAEAPLCIRACTVENDFRCVSSCGEVSCELPNTVCDPADGGCKCGPPGQETETCESDECCFGANGCDDPCNPSNPCAGNPREKGCRRDCAEPQGYTCFDRCAGVSCSISSTVCDPIDGLCKCGTNNQLCPTESYCCVDGDVPGYGNDAAEICVADPCDPSPCGALQCIKDCVEPDGFTCRDNCTASRIDACLNGNSSRNPECNPMDGSCYCTVGGTPDVCAGSERCISDVSGNGAQNSLGCDDPCAPNPCGALACVRDGRLAKGFECVDRCTLPGAPSCGGERNPVCDSSTGACACGDLSAGFDTCNTSSAWNAGECCNANTCEQPCNDSSFPNNNPCTDDDTTNPTGNGDNTRCSIACADGGPDFTCSDPCGPTACGGGNAGSTARNPDCIRQTNNGGRSRCRCIDDSDGGIENCSGGQCCGSSGCYDPCAGNPCAAEAVNKRCEARCSPLDDAIPDYTCEPACTANSCPLSGSPGEPTCNPLTDGSFECLCGGAQCNGATAFCTAAEVCVPNPCEPDPCTSGVLTQCVIDRAQPAGFRCEDPCASVNCAQPQPDETRPGDGNSCVCACGSNSCTGSSAFCASGGVCDSDPCEPDPCTTGNNTACVVDRGQPNGYRCVDPCDGISCGQPEPDLVRNNDTCECACGSNTNCSGSTAFCTAAAVCDANPCDPDPCTTGNSTACVVDRAQPNGYRCVDPCAAVTCSQPEPTATRPGDGNTCVCVCGGSACTGENAFCVGGTTCDSDPCAPHPCEEDACVYDSSDDATPGFRCINYCDGSFGQPDEFTCPAQNPDCDNRVSDASSRCGCGIGFQECTNSQCCVGGSCSDACVGDPCSSDSLDARRCVSDCSQIIGYTCENWCPNGPSNSFAGSACTTPLTTCNPNNGNCECGQGENYESCSAGDNCCFVDEGNTSLGVECRAPQCTASSCAGNSDGRTSCNPCSGCFDPTGG